MSVPHSCNVVVITRSADDEVFVAGGDEHVEFMVGVCGFARVPAPGIRQYRLADGHDELEKVCLATEVAQLLTVAGYEIALDESLGVRAEVRFVPQAGGRMATRVKADLEREIDSVAGHVAHASDPAEAARVLDVLVGEGGVMERTIGALRSVSFFTDDQQSRQDEVADSLGFVAEVMSDLRRLAAEAVGRLAPGSASRAEAARLSPSRTPRPGMPRPGRPDLPPRLHRPDPSSDRGPSR
ncbi:hypothetical protein [Peterkaempfera bronchialis]|uniref:hypothetical protein n=1 Tax=Peterkaempfera bronchialis TaxID=2126346 RepID=UPI003C2DB39A